MTAVVTVANPDNPSNDKVDIICANNLQLAFDPATTSSGLTFERSRNGSPQNPALAVDSPKYVWVLNDVPVGQADIGRLLTLINTTQPALIKESTPRYLTFIDGVKLRRITGSDYSTSARVTIDGDFSKASSYIGDIGNGMENVYLVNLTVTEV